MSVDEGQEAFIGGVHRNCGVCSSSRQPRCTYILLGGPQVGFALVRTFGVWGEDPPLLRFLEMLGGAPELPLGDLPGCEGATRGVQI